MMPRVLIVDDEWGIRATLQEFLKDDGFDVETAADVDEAVRRLKAQAFDVIVTDVIMPRASGVDLLKVIHDTRPLTQVILITGEPMLDIATQALRSGAFDYLQKPVTKQKITSVVGAAAKVKILLDDKARLEAENRRYRKELEILLDDRTRALLESEELHQSLVAHMPCAFLHLRQERDEHKRPARLVLVEANEPFYRLMNLPASDPPLRDLREVLPMDPTGNELYARLWEFADSGIEACFSTSPNDAHPACDWVVCRPREGTLLAFGHLPED